MPSPLVKLRVKICGITRPEQGAAVARLGASALGFICVPKSPRYVTPTQIQAIGEHLSADLAHNQLPQRIGVFADADLNLICQTVATAQLTGVQLHGQESPGFCQQVRQALPQIEVIKALRIGGSADLAAADDYQGCVDTLLLDAYDPGRLGGTGKTLNWQTLQTFRCPFPWFLAGGLTPDNILEALDLVQPDGIDLSSGVEHRPGDKDLDRVARLFERLQSQT
jgi:phosphoribosylanthranilate isomerase